MASNTLSQSLRAIWAQVHSPAGLPFPQTVAKLTALKVTRYHVDYVANNATSYVPNAQTGNVDVDVASIPSHGVPPRTGAEWNAEGLINATKRTQRGETNYQQFATECIDAGVTNYFAYLDGKRVVYMGGVGDFHVEWFPGHGTAKKD